MQRFSADVKRLATEELGKDDTLKQMILELVGRAGADTGLAKAGRRRGRPPGKGCGSGGVTKEPCRAAKGQSDQVRLGPQRRNAARGRDLLSLRGRQGWGPGSAWLRATSRSTSLTRRSPPCSCSTCSRGSVRCSKASSSKGRARRPMSDPNVYIMLMSSLPSPEALFLAKRPPLSRLKLDRRLRVLAPEHARALKLAEQVLHWGDIPLDMTDEEIVGRAKKAMKEIESETVRLTIRDRLEIRTCMVALRRRHRGEPAPGPGTVWGFGRWDEAHRAQLDRGNLPAGQRLSLASGGRQTLEGRRYPAPAANDSGASLEGGEPPQGRAPVRFRGRRRLRPQMEHRGPLGPLQRRASGPSASRS